MATNSDECAMQQKKGQRVLARTASHEQRNVITMTSSFWPMSLICMPNILATVQTALHSIAKKVMAAFYTSDALRDAKCVLWSHFEDYSNFLEAM